MTCGEIVALYLRHADATRKHCPESRAERVRTLSAFVRDLGHIPVDAAKPFHLSDWIESHTSWKSISTKRARANMVRAAFAWAVEEERIDRNPFRKVRYEEAERRPDMPDDALDCVCRLANKPFERAARFLRLTGCRLSELCRAEWQHVDMDRGIWLIPKHKSRRRTGKAKPVALTAAAIEVLRQCRHHSDSGIIFRNTRGTPWTRRTLGQQLARLKKRHKIATPASLHGVRHRFGSAAAANGASMKQLAQQLGHSSSAITERYYVDLTSEMESLRRAAELAAPNESHP